MFLHNPVHQASFCKRNILHSASNFPIPIVLWVVQDEMCLIETLVCNPGHKLFVFGTWRNEGAIKHIVNVLLVALLALLKLYLIELGKVLFLYKKSHYSNELNGSSLTRVLYGMRQIMLCVISIAWALRNSRFPLELESASSSENTTRDVQTHIGYKIGWWECCSKTINLSEAVSECYSYAGCR